MGLRTRLILLVLFLILPALILAIYSNSALRRFGAYKVERDAGRVVDLASVNELTLIESTRQHLTALSRFPEALGNNIKSFDNFFEKLLQIYKEYNDFGLLEINGDLISSAYGRLAPTNRAEETYFKRAVATKEFAIGDLHTDATGRKSLMFAYPIMNEKGDLARVVFAALKLELIQQAAAKTKVPEGGILEIMDSAGNILACSPELPSDNSSQPVVDDRFLTLMQERKYGTAERRGQDKVLRLYSFNSLGPPAGGNIFLSVGIPKAAAYQEISNIFRRNLIVLGIVAVVALGAALVYSNVYILKPIQALVRATKRLAEGDLQARTGLLEHQAGELKQLAAGFDRMAESLSKQRQEIESLNSTLEQRVVERTTELELANKELDAFSSTVSHDLRAPLRQIDAFIEMLKGDNTSALSETGLRHFETIARKAQQMNSLIENLLLFARTGRGELNRVTQNMENLVREVIKEMERDLQGRNIEWTIGPLPSVAVDRPMLKQVWVNLLANAVKYTRQRNPAKIEIQARANERQEYVFSVRDNGAGFDMKYAHKLFGVFQRLHENKDFEGTGIGLANVLRIIVRHGGRVWAEGKPDAGATFYFTLPIQVQPAIIVGK